MAAAFSGIAATITAVAVAAAGDVPLFEASQGSILWQREFTSPGEDWINELTPLRDGRFLASGYLGRIDGEEASDWRALAVTFDADGNIAWQREHGAGGGIDAYWNGVEAADGRFALTGFTTRIGAGGIDACFAILTREGWIVKENAYGGPKYDRATDLAPAADGGFVLAGMTESFGAGKRDILLLKVDGNGIEQWRRIYGEPGNDAALYIESTTDNGFVIAGGTEGANEDSQILVMKIDSEGRETWRRTVGEPDKDDVNHGLALLPDGRIVVTGYSKSWDARDNDVLVALLSPAGEIERIDMIGGADDDRPITPKVDSNGHVWIVGYTKSAGAGGWDVLVVSYAPKSGFRNVFATFGGADDDNGTALQPLSDRSLLVAGYSKNLSTPSADAFVMRVSTLRDQKLPTAIRKRKVFP
ncbi:MAG TPA: hypothetical protein VLD59_08050 [Steroidobacteraceae bacterium]|nr:hypothetical protein [Steroidobacteraceae bacterium]